MFDTRSMHHIQRRIITELAHTSPLRFSKLQPHNIPNNTFSYHLKKLTETGYIELTESGYVATRKALKTIPYAGTPERRMVRPVTISMIYVMNEKNEVLVQKRTSRPFFNWYGIPSGLIHTDESVDQAAKRELYEKTGIVISGESLKQHGVLDFRYIESITGDLFVHAIAFVYSYRYVDTGDGLLPPHTEWASLDSAIRILPEVVEVADMVRRPSLTIRSVNFDEPMSERVQ